MNLPALAIRYRVVVNFTVVLLVLGGIYAYRNLGKLEDPEFTVKEALVVTTWSGATPHEVEQQVTDVIERAVQAAEGLDEIESLSRAGVSIVKVSMKESYRAGDMPQLWDGLRRKVNDCQGALPVGAGPSNVHDDYGDVFGIFLALTGDGFSLAELGEYAEYVQRELLLVDDVARVELYGERTEVVEVVPSRSRMAQMGVHPGMIVATLNAQDRVVRTGSLDAGDLRVRVRPSGSFDGLDAIGDLVLQGAPDAPILLRDVADIRRATLDPPQRIMRYDGRDALGMGVSVASGGDVVALGEAVRARLDELVADLPVGIEVHTIYDQPALVTRSIDQFLLNLVESVIIVVGVLLLTMGLRSGLLIGSGLVLSILGTMIFMLIAGIDMQRVSLGSFILAMGMLVDNAIVVTDGALVAMQRGVPRRRAAIEAAQRTAWPLLGATLVAVLAFLPIFLAPNNTGEYVSSLFIVVGVSLMLSWLLALTQTPVACDLFLKAPRDGAADPHGNRAHVLYRRFLERCLRRRIRTVLVMVLLLVAAMAGFRQAGRSFFPASNKPMLMVDLWTPAGSGVEGTAHAAAEVEAFLADVPEVAGTATCVGGPPLRYYLPMNLEDPDPSYAQVIVNVHDHGDIPAVKARLEDWFGDHLAGVRTRLAVHIVGMPVAASVEARYTGPDPAVLRSLAENAERVMRADSYTISVRNDWRDRVAVLAPTFDQARARRVGVSRADVASSLSRLTMGQPVGWFREDDERLPILVRAAADERADLDNVGAAPIWGMASRAGVPLDQVTAGAEIDWEDPVIRRFQRRRSIQAQCDANGVTGALLQARLQDDIEDLPVPPGYELSWEGENRPRVESNRGVMKFLPVALLLMCLITVVLFNSVRQPLIIALVLPLEIIGITVGLLVTGVPFGFMALLGALSLIGMLIKNAVVLLDEIGLQIREGKGPWAAVIEASVSRMRPVAMAAGTTVLGMLPLVSDPLFQGLAVTIIFGLTFATVLTLVVVPVLYTLLYRVSPEARV